MSRLLLVAFTPDDALQTAGFAQALGLPYDTLTVSGEPRRDLGAEKALAFNLPSLPPADFLASAIAPLIAPYTRVATLSSMRGKDVFGRLAGLLDCPLVTDVLAVEAPDTFRRPILAGSVTATVQTNGDPVLLTVRPAGFPTPQIQGESPLETLKPAFQGKTKRLAEASRSGARPDLTQAKVVVSGGRPLKDAETFERILGGLADALGGAVGATRAAVDSGIAPNEIQVGQTGKVVAPDLYIAAGVSGSTQHMAGIKDSKTIVAINTDPDAPIFEIADLGLVADLYTAIPEIQSKL